MRKLKLQMQMTIDGFVAGPNGELDWMVWDWDSELGKYVNQLTDSVDTILMGRKMTPGFISYWSDVVKNPSHLEYSFAKKMMDKPKVVFSRTLKKSEWENTTIANGDTVEFINKLKEKPGKDIIVYGGAGFVSSLIKSGIIDEYHFFMNPAAIGKGMKIFSEINNKLPLRLINSKPFEVGIVLNHFQPEN